MTKQAFSDALAAGLTGAMPDSDVEQIVRFYAESIEDRMEDGMTESDAVEAVGPADVRIQEILAALDEIAAAGALQGPSQVSQAATGTPAVTVAAGADTPSDGTVDGVASGATEPAANSLTLSPAGIRQIRISAKNGDITVRPSGHTYIHVTYTDTAATHYVIQQLPDGVLSIRQEQRQDGDMAGAGAGAGAGSLAGLLSRILHTFGNEPDAPVILRVPAAWCGALQIHTGNGDVSVEDLAFDALSAQTGNGDVRASRLRVSGDVQISTASGDVQATALTAQRAALRAASGDVILQDLQAEQLELKTASGDVTADGCRTDTLSAGTANGDVDCRLDTPPKTAALKAANGNLSLALPQPLAQYTVQAKTISGDVDLPACTMNGPYHIRLESVSGDIRMTAR